MKNLIFMCGGRATVLRRRKFGRRGNAALPILLFALFFAAMVIHANAYYLASYGKVSAPFPFDPYGGTEPIVTLDSSHQIYLIADMPQSYAALQQSHQSMSMNQMRADSRPLPQWRGEFEI